MIDHGHRSAAARFRAGQMLMLKSLNESTMNFAFLLIFHG
jgi:hypothetical protein